MNRSMKFFATSIAALASVYMPVAAQGLINNGAYIVNNGAYVIVTGATGNYTNQDAGPSIGLVDNTGVMQIYGDWTNNSVQNVFTANTGTVELNGSNQIVGGSTPTWFNNLTLLGTGNKTLNQDETVGGGYASPAGILALNDRPLILTTRKLTVTNPLNTAITRTSGYIESEMNAGTNTAIVQWNVGANNAAYVFPFGTTAAPALYIPLTITKTSGNTDILASTRMTTAADNSPWHTAVTQMWSQTIPGAGEVPVVIDRWWDINATSSFTGAVDFTYRGVENTTTYSPSGSFAAQNWIGSSWNAPVGAGPGVLAGTAVVSMPAQTLGSASPWVLSNLSSPLPVELLYFDAKPKGKIVLLNWSTASEINNAYFEIQRSRDNETFETIEVVNGAGNSTTVNNYSGVDYYPFADISYYRLRQVDFDGKYTFSQSVAVQIDDSGIFDFVFATQDNSSSSVTLGYYSNTEGEVGVLITDVVGNKIASASVFSVNGFNKKELRLPVMSTAVYFITLTNSSNSVTRKFFMQ